MRGAELLPLLHDHLPASGLVHAASPAVGAALDRPTTQEPLTELATGSVAAVLLLEDELATAGDRAETLLAEAVRVCRPGGLVAAHATSALPPRLRGEAPSGRTFTADDLAHAFGERGMGVVLLCAPGVGAALAGRAWAGRDDLAVDRTPGLLDAGTDLLVAATTPRSERQRTRRFFASVAPKIVAASVLCHDDRGRLLLIHDSFKEAWGLPGGLVDAGEDPASAAAREAWEEGGVKVTVGDLLGVFAADFPDRLLLVYDASPLRVEEHPEPRHLHEVDEVRWATPQEAARLLPAEVRRRVRRCRERPGATWRE